MSVGDGNQAGPVQAWQRLSSTPGGNYRVFNTRTDICRRPSDGYEKAFAIIEAPDWVNVVALTGSGEFVMVRQWRVGSDTIEIEVPGGMIDRDDPDPVAAGLRELREETGYTGENARILGRVFPNPAIMENSCYMVLVENCVRSHSTDWDPGEEIEVVLTPVAEAFRLVSSGGITHPLVISALTQYAMRKEMFTMT